MIAVGPWGGGVVPLPWMECCSLFHAACEIRQMDETSPTAARAGHVKVARTAESRVPKRRGGVLSANPISGSRYVEEAWVSRGVGERGRPRLALPRQAVMWGVETGHAAEGGERWAPLEECAESQAERAEGMAVLAW